MKSNEKPTNHKDKKSKLSGWKKVVTTASIALAWFFSSCDEVPSNQIILNPNDKSEKFSLEYVYSWWSSEPLVIDYNVYIHQSWEKFKWKIEKSDWWIGKDITHIESGDIDDFFNSISDNLDSDYITDETRWKKDAKVSFAKQVYKDKVLNNGNPSNDKEITIAYSN